MEYISHKKMDVADREHGEKKKYIYIPSNTRTNSVQQRIQSLSFSNSNSNGNLTNNKKNMKFGQIPSSSVIDPAIFYFYYFMSKIGQYFSFSFHEDHFKYSHNIP